MNCTQKFFVGVLGAFLKQESIPAIPENIDWNEFRSLAKMHSVAGMIGHTFSSEVAVPQEVKLFFKKKAFSTVMVSSAHISLGNNVIEKMAEHNIICAPFKGAVIRKYYPVEELRTFSDIDILVPESRFEDAHKIMMDMGFEHTDGVVGVRGYKKDGFHFEIHTSLAGDYTQLNSGEAEFFSASTEQTLPAANGESFARLDKDYHFAYCLWHLAKHLSGSGAGVRMFMDIAVLIEQCGIDSWENVNRYLEMLGISDAAKSILFLCNRWFGSAVPELFFGSVDEETALAMEEYVITAGTFGFSARTTGSSRLRNEITDEGAIKNARGKTILKMFFPDSEYMVKQYPWYSGSNILLPFMWIYRWCHLLFSRRKNSLKALGDVAYGGEKELKEALLLKKIGWNIYSKK